MGWLDGWWSDAPKTSDPLASIDPKVREFLQRESPVKYNTASSTPSETKPSTEATAQQAPVDESARPLVPKESLFQDGRYAHLWKGYKPQGEIEAESKTDHEKLMDVLEGYKDRKYNLGRAALENCAIQQEEWINCMKNGAWEDRLQMCRKQVQRFERCYTMQTRLLKALGYKSIVDRPAHVDEDIQMHADSLYVRMIDQEKAIKGAEERGLPAPEFKNIFPKPENAIEPGAELRKSWDEQLDKLPAAERATEEAALRADFQAKAAVAKDVQKLWDEQAAARKAREAGGQTSIAEKVTDIFRFR
ncbi:hypothetical protein HYQ45_009261 [Verticillium longisporum]|uniref:Autophagy protein n=3 Tax=Verticillium TaxID=1036719 RepID=G2WTB2_VERDV|nr:uncharacterized protein VDAG_01035 [Verticillium dahliae VdLs.17]KAF3348629.1 putative transporter C11D3.18C [Verticillium dahliae VDG2]KAF3357471.1 PRKR-interacting protein 1-like protein [Verticillium dahliae VDG1]KAG7132390.1 hypothetical protein HYQ45_009261 [Verticillium longisporum]KAH6701539.1 hypothetical protein EV126DRAFT_419306 [Verticillium dahliae]EGY17353.1 hypothetical protein VDAG_01035 [Verticillium dahliae VdLs.17]